MAPQASASACVSRSAATRRGGWSGSDRRAGCRRRCPSRVRAGIRARRWPGPVRRSAISTRVSTSSGCWAAIAAGSSSRPATEGPPGRRDRGRLRRLSPLLPGWHGRRGARRLADEEPIRGDDLARRRAWPAGQPRRRPGPGDSLDDFKRGFANGEAPFRTHELICDPAAYERLAAQAGPAPEGFFPAYRSLLRFPLLSGLTAAADVDRDLLLGTVADVRVAEVADHVEHQRVIVRADRLWVQAVTATSYGMSGSG